MKKKYLYIALFFETAACVGAYFIQFFTAKKMGMLRWVNHLCNTWSKKVDLDRVNLLLMLLVLGLVLALVFWTLKRGKEAHRALLPLVGTALGAAGIYLVWTIRYTRRIMAAYYLVSPILLLGTLIALGCWALAVLKKE